MAILDNTHTHKHTHTHTHTLARVKNGGHSRENLSCDCTILFTTSTLGFPYQNYPHFKYGETYIDILLRQGKFQRRSERAFNFRVMIIVILKKKLERSDDSKKYNNVNLHNKVHVEFIVDSGDTEHFLNKSFILSGFKI